CDTTQANKLQIGIRTSGRSAAGSRTRRDSCLGAGSPCDPSLAEGERRHSESGAQAGCHPQAPLTRQPVQSVSGLPAIVGDPSARTSSDVLKGPPCAPSSTPALALSIRNPRTSLSSSGGTWPPVVGRQSNTLTAASAGPRTA